ncbi:MAG: FMN-binding protein [Phycisphaerales bacterium]|nr:MAG: FMN-binding protein [Phycisphaerales bacterium]
MAETRRQTPKAALFKYLSIIVVLSAAAVYGRFRSGPVLEPYVHEVFPEAARMEVSDGIYAALTEQGKLLGWAGVGSASGYGGPLLVIVGIDTEGHVVGARVVEHRETPLFLRMARVSRFFASLTGRSFDRIDYDYEHVVGVTGASRSAGAITAGVRAAVMKIAARKFSIQLSSPERPFEFGILEITLLVLFTIGIASQYLGSSVSELLRWASQIVGLLIIGFWKNSPLTIAKITALLAGYFPGLRWSVSLYLLITGFVLTVMIFGTSIYCSHVCPFGAVQRCIGAVGGRSARLPTRSVRLLRGLRNFIVFFAVFSALIVSKPALASYEPFAVVFALKGSLLQWFLLLIVILASLVINRPWCRLFCPMRVCERVLQDARQRGIDYWKARRHD